MRGQCTCESDDSGVLEDSKYLVMMKSEKNAESRDHDQTWPTII